MVEKRAAPTIALVNGTGALLEVNVAGRNISSIGSVAPNTKGSYVSLNSSGLTSPNMVMVYDKPNVLSASAEL
jgi:hypothetical protein